MNVSGRFLRDRANLAALAVISGIALLALLAPFVSPVDPNQQVDVLANRFLPPLSTGADGIMHWLGTDRFGRDLLARMLYGARISLTVGILSMAVSIVIGYSIGAAAGAGGPAMERVLMAFTDAALAMPRLVWLLALVALWEPSMILVILVLGLTGWMGIARLTRAEVKAIVQLPFMEATEGAGLSRSRILFRHIIPNTVTPVLIAGALGVGHTITLESGLAFLGVGVPPPAPSWGSLIAGGRDALVHAPWVATFPGLAIVLTVVAFNLLADGVRDALDPKADSTDTRDLSGG